MHLALLDIDEENLSKAKNSLAGLDSSLKTEAYAIDVGDVTAWKQISERLRNSFPEIDLVVLNAGKSYKPQEQTKGRLNPWLDGSYWRNVSWISCRHLYYQAYLGY